VQPQSQRHKQLLNITGGAGRPQTQQQQQQQQGGAARQKQHRQQQPLPQQQQQQQQEEGQLGPLPTKCKFCFQPPPPGKELKQVQVGAALPRQAPSPLHCSLMHNAWMPQ
jgi:hypothetical protein